MEAATKSCWGGSERRHAKPDEGAETPSLNVVRAEEMQQKAGCPGAKQGIDGDEGGQGEQPDA